MTENPIKPMTEAAEAPRRLARPKKPKRGLRSRLLPTHGYGHFVEKGPPSGGVGPFQQNPAMRGK